MAGIFREAGRGAEQLEHLRLNRHADRRHRLGGAQLVAWRERRLAERLALVGLVTGRTVCM